VADAAGLEELAAGTGRAARRLVRFLPLLLVRGVVTGLVLPAGLGSGHTRGPRRSKCTSNLKQIGLACHLFSSDHDEAFPLDLAAAYPRYVPDARVLLCPSSGRAKEYAGGPASMTPDNSDYCYVSGLKATDPPLCILAFDVASNHEGDGMNVLYLGGNVEWKADIAAVHEQLGKQREEMAARGRTLELMGPSWIRRAQTCRNRGAAGAVTPGVAAPLSTPTTTDAKRRTSVAAAAAGVLAALAVGVAIRAARTGGGPAA
jgi:hypothetical protein